MVLGIVLGADSVADTAGHGHSTQTSGTDKGIDLLLGKEVPNLSHADTRSDTESEGTETACHNTQSLHIDEGIHCHGGTHTESQEDGGCIHDAIGSSIKEAEGEAEAILKVQQAKADGIRMLREAGADEAVLRIKSLEAFERAADGQATKIIIPSEIQGMAGLVKSVPLYPSST